MFSVCAVTHAMAERGNRDLPAREEDDIGLSESFLTEVDNDIFICLVFSSGRFSP